MSEASDLGDLQVLTALELEEPSPRSDQSILEGARAGAAKTVRRRSWGLATRVAVAAATVLLAPAFFLLLAPRLPPPETTARAVKVRSEKEIRLAISGLRADLEEIHEMTDLIEPERLGDRDTILARVRACLEDLDQLERKMVTGSESSMIFNPERKEENA
ncbi:MAG: hypothetical protein HY717_05395 [Planctomycetes bacterium]|nr:hypothetical protein [Planctomycetota bacterium]